MKDLKQKKQWVCWKYLQDGDRLTKKPYAVTGAPTGSSEDHASEWVTYAEACAALRDAGKGFDGVGFVMPKGYFLLDIDHRDLADPLVCEIRAHFASYTELSPSGNGIHVYGMADFSQLPIIQKNDGAQVLDGKYLTRNTGLGVELYIGGLTNRFSTFTGNQIDVPATSPDGIPPLGMENVDDVRDCTSGVLWLLKTCLARKTAAKANAPVDPEKYVTLTEEDIPAILDALRSQKNGSKFKALFDEGRIPEGESQSEADAALCAMIAFRAGPNPPLIDTIFRQSALMRDKWDREDYRSATIDGAIRLCDGVFHKSLKVRPPFVQYDEQKDRDYVSATLLAAYIRKNLAYKLVTETSRGGCRKYVYQDGCYRLYSDEMFKGAIKRFIAEYDENLVKMSVVEETFKLLSTDLDHIPQTALNADERYINFMNGLLDIRSMTLAPHDSAVLSSIQIPCEWHGAPALTPVFDAYLDTLTNGDAETKTLLLEFMGACLSNVRGHRMKKVLFLYGEGNTGKSQIKRLTEMLLGDGNYTGIDLQQMEARFGTSSIYGKRLAGSSDMSFMTVDELKIFKKATGGDALFAEFKGQDSFEFVYSGLLWFCMNELPKFGGDDGQWVYDRIIPVHCPNVIEEAKQDHELLDKMYRERGGIVYKAVMAFRDVIARGYRFTEPERARANRTVYQAENNTAVEFFQVFIQIWIEQRVL